jgi:hypothetical protein
MTHGHVRVICRICKCVIMQCRCPSKDKRIEYQVCDKCQPKEGVL